MAKDILSDEHREEVRQIVAHAISHALGFRDDAENWLNDGSCYCPQCRAKLNGPALPSGHA